MEFYNQHNILFLKFDSKYWANSTMLRIQEYYESPYENIRGKFFTLEEYMDTNARQTGTFDYYNAWSGFNIPGHIVKEFFEVFSEDTLLEKEKNLKKTLSPFLKSKKPFYVIATNKADGKRVWPHEVAHALYYLNDEYKKEMDSLYEQLDSFQIKTMNKTLTKMGYAETVFPDETQAYLATSSDQYFSEWFKHLEYFKPNIKKFTKVYKKYTKELGISVKI